MHARLLGESFKAGSGKICAILGCPKPYCKHKTLQALEAGLRSMCSPASMHAYILEDQLIHKFVSLSFVRYILRKSARFRKSMRSEMRAAETGHFSKLRPICGKLRPRCGKLRPSCGCNFCPF